MNATSLYVSTCKIILQANAEDSASWMDLFTHVPYLRQSLSCTVCGKLLIEPYTPTETNCQHHVCKSCKGGKKKLKPSCSWCKDYGKYVENVQLRVLLQCYKKLCEYLKSTTIYEKLINTNPTHNAATNLLDGTTPTLSNLINEGTGYVDEFCTTTIRPQSFVISSSNTNTTSTQTQPGSTTSDDPKRVASTNKGSERHISDPLKTTHNGTSMYSVLHTGSGNKLTIKRKANNIGVENDLQDNRQNSVHGKKTTRGTSVTPLKIGCRCGSTSAMPGKLTCCGQRCACYIDSKPCVDCKCRGCRNPHIVDGQKVCAVYQLQLAPGESLPQSSSSDFNTTATSSSSVQVSIST